ncbi:MAG: hypothetical protein EZS28_037862, partial [Streblomastix strix]
MKDKISNILEFITSLNIRLLYGTDSKIIVNPTGDQQIDGISCPRTLKKHSKTLSVLYDPRDCFVIRVPEECENKNRVYSFKGIFNGFEALYFKYIMCVTKIIDTNLTQQNIDMGDYSIQEIGSLIMYDLMGGALAYRDSLISDQHSITNQHRNEIIIFFIFSVVTLLIGFNFFLVRIRRLIFDVELRTQKMELLDPNSDVSERIGMGSASYKTDSSCDCMRMDQLNQKVLLYVAHLCASIDWTMNIEKETQDIIKMNEQNQSEEIDTILQLANIVKYERQQLQIMNDDSKMLVVNQIISDDEEHLKNIRRCVLNLLSIVFRFFCN